MSTRPIDIRPLPFTINRVSIGVDDLKTHYDKDTKTYIFADKAWLLGALKPLPSFFRVHWRVLNVDGFHYTLMFEPAKYKFNMEYKKNGDDSPTRQPL